MLLFWCTTEVGFTEDFGIVEVSVGPIEWYSGTSVYGHLMNKVT